jgi:hypothetical protein
LVSDSHSCCPRFTFFSAGGDEEQKPPDGYAPTFIEKPRIVPNATGTLITMQCKVKAKPKPEFVWYKGKSRVTESSRVVIRTVEVDAETFEYYLDVKVMDDPVCLIKFHFKLVCCNSLK